MSFVRTLVKIRRFVRLFGYDAPDIRTGNPYADLVLDRIQESSDKLLDKVGQVLFDRNHKNTINCEAPLLDKTNVSTYESIGTILGMKIPTNKITPCNNIGTAIVEVEPNKFVLIYERSMKPVESSPTLYSFIDTEEHSGYRLVRTLPDGNGRTNYNYIDKAGRKLCREDLSFAMTFDDQGKAHVQKAASCSFVIDTKGIVLEKTVLNQSTDINQSIERSTGIKR